MASDFTTAAMPMPAALFGKVSWSVVVFAIVVVLGIIGGIVWYTKRRQSQQDVNEQSDAERLQERQQREDHHVPLRKRALRKTPTETKAMALLTALLVGYVMFEIWTYLKTGAPSQVMYAAATVDAVLVGVGVIGGVYVYRWFDGRYGMLVALLEAQPDEGRSSTTPMIVYYHTEDVVETEQGTAIHAYSERKTLGLFRLPKRVADVPLVRDDSDLHRPSTDKVTYSIPDRAVEVQDNVHVFRTKGRQVSSSQETEVDVVWQSGFSMSREDKQRFDNDMEMLKVDLKETKAKKARYSEYAAQLERQLAAALEDNWEQFDELATKFYNMFGNDRSRGSSSDTVEVPKSMLNGDGRSPREQAGYAASGDSTPSESTYTGNGQGRGGDR